MAKPAKTEAAKKPIDIQAVVKPLVDAILAEHLVDIHSKLADLAARDVAMVPWDMVKRMVDRHGTALEKVADGLMALAEAQPKAPPPHHDVGRPPSAQKKGRMSDEQMEARIRDSLKEYETVKWDAAPRSRGPFKDLVAQRVGKWVKKEEHQGKTWVQMLGDIGGRDYLWFRVNKEATDANTTDWRQGWGGKFKDDAIFCLWLLQWKDRIIDQFSDPDWAQGNDEGGDGY